MAGRGRGRSGSGGLPGVPGAAGEGGDGRGLEDVADRQRHVEGRTDAGGEAGGEQGVAAEGEEVVVGSDVFAFEELREEVGDDLLLRGGRGASAGGGGLLRFGQGGAVELAVGGQRPVVDGDDGGGDEVVGQPRPQGFAEPVRGERSRGGGGVGEEPGAAAGGGAGQDDGVGDLVERGERGAGLSRLDAEAPDLHLLVGTPEIVEFAVGRPAGQVTGAVHAGAGLAVRVRDEAGGGEGVPSQVAPGQAGPGDVELSRGAGGDGVERGVEHPDGEVGQRPTDGTERGVGPGRLVGFQGPVGDVHRGLGDAVHVDQFGSVVPVPCEPAGEARGVERLTAEDDGAQRESVHAGPARVLFAEEDVRELVEGGRGLVEDGDAFAAQECGELLGGAGGGARDDDEASAVQQCAEDLPDGEVEGVAVEERPHVLRPEREVLVGGVQQPQYVAVFDDDALGAAGGPGGVDDVGGGVRGDRGDGVRGAVRGGGDVGQGQPALAGAVGGSVGRGQGLPPGGRVREADHRPGGGELVPDALGGGVGGQRQVGRAGLEDAEDGADLFGGRGQGEGHEGAGAPRRAR